MRGLPRSSTSFPKTGPSFRKNVSITENPKPLQIRVEGTCQPPRPATTMVVREFYANLTVNVLKKVRVQGVLVDFSVKSINEFYSLESVNS